MADTALKRKAAKINSILAERYPDAKCSLDFTSPLELLVATVLSAQCTDVRVNIVTKDLFRKYRTAADYANAAQSELEQDIHSTGFYSNKAKSIIGFAKLLVSEHGGEVPRTMDELVRLPGVGRKSANVLLGNAFDTPGIVVDTHVTRVSQRLGLSNNTDAVKIEFDLMALVPRKDWTIFSHRIVFHGRGDCQARKPACDACPVAGLCDYFAAAKSK